MVVYLVILYYKFSAELLAKKLKIGQYLAKIWATICGLLFWPTRYTDDRSLIWKISNGDICTTGHLIHFMFGSRAGFRVRRIEWHYFWFDRIQDGSRKIEMKNWKISNECISGIGYPIHFYEMDSSNLKYILLHLSL